MAAKPKRIPLVPDNCPGCGSDSLWGGWFDEDDLAVPLGHGEPTPPGVRWTVFCQNCGDEIKAR